MDIQDCECYSKGLNYIVWQHSEVPKGIFIVHIGGNNKRLLYKMMKELLETEFKGLEIYFCTQREEYWRNHSVLDGYIGDLKVYKFIKRIK